MQVIHSPYRTRVTVFHGRWHPSWHPGIVLRFEVKRSRLQDYGVLAHFKCVTLCRAFQNKAAPPSWIFKCNWYVDCMTIHLGYWLLLWDPKRVILDWRIPGGL